MKKWEQGIWSVGLVALALGFLPGAWLKFQYGKWVGVYLLSFGLLGLFLFQKPVFPAFKKWQALGLGSLFCLLLAHLFWFHPQGFEFSLLDRLSFFLLALSAWRGFSAEIIRWRNFFWPAAVALLGVSAYGLWQFASVGFPGSMPYTTSGSTFGHANNAAQFVGLTLLLWWALPPQDKNRGHGRGLAEKVALAAISSLSFAYLVLSRGRSALLAFAAGLCVMFVLKRRRDFSWKILRLPAAGLAGAVILFGGVQLSNGKSFSEIVSFAIFSEKAPMMDYRLDVWKQTTKMIQANPFGVGVDRYAFNFIPFHQRGHTLSYTHLALAPHNEFLRYLAEDGIPLAILIIGAWGALLFLWWRAGAAHKEILLPAAAFFLVEMFVQFPWQNPYPFFLGALGVGAMASELWKPRVIPANAWVRSGAVVILLLFGFLVGEGAVSRANETTRDEFWAKVSCRAVPSNWQACLNYSRVLLERGDTATARIEIEHLLSLEPWNYAALRHMAVLTNREGNRLESCFFTWKYNDIFQGQSDLVKQYEQNCPKKWRSYFDRKRPARYYSR